MNDSPVANPDTATAVVDGTAMAIDVLANDTPGPIDELGQTLTITAVTQGTTGSVAITGGGTGLTYTPNAGSSDADSFTYTMCDGGTTGGAPDPKCATGTVTVRITRRPTAPSGGRRA